MLFNARDLFPIFEDQHQIINKAFAVTVEALSPGQRVMFRLVPMKLNPVTKVWPNVRFKGFDAVAKALNADGHEDSPPKNECANYNNETLLSQSLLIDSREADG
jgi:hypothetical protein